MLVGLFLRNIKTYQGINYIPLSDVERFCGLVGSNGIGKSSVLESLDCFFNNKQWNHNTIVKKSGLNTTKPHIVPVFLVNKHDVGAEFRGHAESINSVVNDFTESQASNTSVVRVARSFIQHREQLKRNINFEECYLLPIGLDHKSNVSVSILNSRLLVERFTDSEPDSIRSSLDADELNQFMPLLNHLQESIEYIYPSRN